jgi:hypothetical protein
MKGRAAKPKNSTEGFKMKHTQLQSLRQLCIWFNTFKQKDAERFTQYLRESQIDSNVFLNAVWDASMYVEGTTTKKIQAVIAGTKPDVFPTATEETAIILLITFGVEMMKRHFHDNLLMKRVELAYHLSVVDEGLETLGAEEMITVQVCRN